MLDRAKAPRDPSRSARGSLDAEPSVISEIDLFVTATDARGRITLLDRDGLAALARDWKLFARALPLMQGEAAQIDAAEDREKFRQLLERLGLHQSPSATALTVEEAAALAGVSRSQGYAQVRSGAWPSETSATGRCGCGPRLALPRPRSRLKGTASGRSPSPRRHSSS